MDFISKQDLLKAIKKKYEDLTNESGCTVRTNHGNEWLSVADIVELVNGCDSYEETNTDNELEHMCKELKDLRNEFELSKKAYEKRIEIMQSALLKLTADNKSVDGVQVTKTDFLAIYDKALKAMFAQEENGTLDPYCNDIYGYDFTIHWHGIYCNCYDGAMPSNHIIPAIEGLNEEDPDEGWGF